MGPENGSPRVAALAVLTLLSLQAWAEAPRKIAVMDCEILDDTRQYNTAEVNEAQDKRLNLITEELKRQFTGRSLYEVVDSGLIADRIEEVKSRETFYGCNGCEVEVHALNSPVYDIERFGIHFVASPRHADMLLVSGAVTRNMELALVKAHRATPDPKVVVAIGACGISGGIFGKNYATLGGVDQVVPVDVYIPGCPPRPQALLYGILLAVGRIEQRGLPQ